MKIGDLVIIKKSGDPKLVGAFGVVVSRCHAVGFISEFVIVQRFDGHKDVYHETRLGLIV